MRYAPLLLSFATKTRNSRLFANSELCGALLQTTLDAKVSRKVLAMARDQQDELAQEDIEELDEDVE
jgi:hypothetical protein